MRIEELLKKLDILIVDEFDVVLSEKTLFHSLFLTGVAVPAARPIIPEKPGKQTPRTGIY